MSTYTVCHKCGGSFARADLYSLVIDGVGMNITIPGYCPYCTPKWPTLEELKRVTIYKGTPEAIRLVVDRCHAAGVKVTYAYEFLEKHNYSITPDDYIVAKNV